MGLRIRNEVQTTEEHLDFYDLVLRRKRLTSHSTVHFPHSTTCLLDLFYSNQHDEARKKHGTKCTSLDKFDYNVDKCITRSIKSEMSIGRVI